MSFGHICLISIHEKTHWETQLFFSITLMKEFNEQQFDPSKANKPWLCWITDVWQMNRLVYTYLFVFTLRVEVNTCQPLFKIVKLNKMFSHVSTKNDRYHHFSKSLPISSIKISHYIELIAMLHQVKCKRNRMILNYRSIIIPHRKFIPCVD